MKNKKKREGKETKGKGIEDVVDVLIRKEEEEEHKLGGFKVIRWKAKQDSSIIRQFFVKVHSVFESTRRKPLGRTLLVINVPPFVQENNLETMFSSFGDLEEVFIHQKPTSGIPDKSRFFPLEKDVIQGYKVAYIVFKDVRPIKEIINLKEEEGPILVLDEDVKCGMKKWIEDYNSKIVSEQELEQDVKQFMIEFERKEVLRKEAEKLAGEADNEGWITVTPHGKRSSVKRTESIQEKLKAKKRKMEKAVLNITPAQIKATKVKQLEELKKKFDEDKQKIALLKHQRKFRPF